MNLLWDTHVLLWVFAGDDRVGIPVRAAIADSGNSNWVSAISLWELAIKLSLGKLQLRGRNLLDVTARMAAEGIGLLALTPEDVQGVIELPFHHRDPFDRLLAVQAQRRAWTLVSADTVFDGYGVDRLW